ncbi:MAG: hypothetical protein INF98_12855 [Roseomonas sp.]|nr:hypothetical protein [Roseomonas sp.]
MAPEAPAMAEAPAPEAAPEAPGLAIAEAAPEAEAALETLAERPRRHGSALPV